MYFGMINIKNTFDAFRREAEVIQPEQQVALKGGYQIAPVQGAHGVSSITWDEIDIRDLKNSKATPTLNIKTFSSI